MTPHATQGSIRRRLLLSLLAGAAVLAIAVFFVVLSVARQVAQESQDNILAASALSILDSARVTEGQVNVDLPYSALSMLDSVSDERVFYAIHIADEFLTGYQDLPSASDVPGNSPVFVSSNFLGEAVRIATVHRSVSIDVGQSYVQVSVAQTLSGQRQTLAQISRSSAAIGAAFFLMSVLLAAVIARSTIKPMDRLAASVSRRGPRDLRPVAAPVPKEMGPLVASLNNLMERLQRSLTRSEEFIVDAAHRVRTPLAIVRTKAEIIERRTEDKNVRATVAEMIHAIDDSSRTAGQLLDHAMVTLRLDHMTKEEVDLGHLVRDTTERLRPILELKGIELVPSQTDSAKVWGDPIVLQNALHNLLDNAIKYAPSGAQVSATVEREARGAAIHIRDTGPGFTEPKIGRLTRRFARGQNADGIVGSGLGLTIAKDVVEAHGGTIRARNHPEGGACVSLYFPLS